MKIQPIKTNAFIPKKVLSTSKGDKMNIKDKCFLAGLVVIPIGVAHISAMISQKFNNSDTVALCDNMKL